MILELILIVGGLAYLRSRRRRTRDHEPRVIRLLPAPRPAVELTRREIRIACSRPGCIACGRELGTIEALRALASMCIVCGRDRLECVRVSINQDQRCRPLCRTCADGGPVAMPIPGGGTSRI